MYEASGICSSVFPACSADCSQQRSTTSSVDRRNKLHIFETVSRRVGILIWSHHHSQFDSTHRTPIANVDSSHFSRRWWRRKRPGHTSQHANSRSPHNHHDHNSNEEPDDVPEHQRSLSGLTESFDDGGVGHATTLTHCLQPIAPAGALQLIQQSCHQSSTRCP